MAGGGGGQASPGDDSALNVIWAIIALFAICLLIWFSFSEQLKFFFLQVRKYELIAINFIMQILPLDLINLGHLKTELSDAVSIASETRVEDLSLNIAEHLSLIAGSYLRYPVILCLIYFSYHGFFKNVTNKYRKHYDMHKLANQERIEWPQINPVIGLDLVNEPLNTGPWSMGKSPVDFCKENKLITISVEESQEFKVGAAVKFKMELDEDKAEAVFVKQLGKLWRSPESLPIHQRALFAIFLARGCREPKVAAKVLRQINQSSNSKHPYSLDFSGIDDVWRKYYNQRIIQDIVHAHAYEFTIFIDLLLLARQDGVLANADFLWLKPIDRLFWYVLSSTGRQTYFVEASGTHAHFLVERSLGRGLSVPYIIEAVKALKLALNDIIYVPTEDEKHQLLQKN